MTLAPWRSVLWTDDTTAKSATTPAGLAWLDPGAMAFCPNCLADDPDLPVWPLRWSLPWSFACTRHQVLLNGTCNECGLNPRHSRIATLLPHSGRVVHPAACRSSGPNARTCLTSLAEQPARALRADDPILATQHRLNELLDANDGLPASQQASIGLTVTPDQWLRDLRALSVLAQLADARPQAPGADPAATNATHEHILARSRQRTRDGHTGNDRTWKYAPENPYVRACLLTWAVSILDGDEGDQAVTDVDSLVERAKVREPELWQRIRSTSRPSTGLHSRFSPKYHGTMSTSMLRAALRGYTPSIEAWHVPPHLTDSLYRDHLAAIPNGTALNLRRTAAIGTVQAVTGWPMLDAADYLGLTKVTAWAAISRTGRETRGTALDGFLRDRITDIIRDLDAAPRTDWQHRRANFTPDWLIPTDDWDAIVGQLIGLRVGRRDGDWTGRHILASAHLWHSVTGNDLTLAPMLQTRNSNGRRHTSGSADKARAWIERSLHLDGRAILDAYARKVAQRIDSETKPA